ncbi:MAG: P-loop containing nucleoside triphosphate hydrolase protein [Olpidium bornovanus]|uniref:Cell division control protein n=1 Tax=Olpidium bornovanus TaxID=278681 RepID=A0A8H7ZMQ4_9FUNG|nr:MAG: P-loop containing nucleoside triphosphate hydrolase protein [Olpidium bornovanus]
MFQEAKALFRQTAAPGRLTGRETEQAAIHQFLFRSVIERRPGSLYISGSPGTGKTASLNEVVATIKSSGSLRRKVVLRSINCMTLSGPRAIFPKIVEEIDGSAVDCRTAVGVLTDSGSSTYCEFEIRVLVAVRRWKSETPLLTVLILDEIDCLLSKDQDVLYKLFEWPTLPNSRLVLVGIANALDLTDRFLPRLRAKGIEPQLLHFNPYDVKDIVNIISERLRGLVRGRDAVGGDKEAAEKPGDVPLMQTSAIEMCARKVAAASGDLRRAMDVCRQAIELVEAEYKRKVGAPASETPAERQKTAVNAKSQVSKGQRQRAPSEAATGVSDAPKASVSHQKLRALSFQQKQVLAVFLLVKNRDVPRAAGAPLSGVSKIQSATESPSRQRDAVTVASLYDAYVSYASRRCFLPPGGASRPGTPRSNLATPTGGAGADDVAVTLGVHADDVHKMMTNACDPQPLLLKFYNLSRADDVVRLEMRDLEEKENAVDMMSAVG